MLNLQNLCKKEKKRKASVVGTLVIPRLRSWKQGFPGLTDHKKTAPEKQHPRLSSHLLTHTSVHYT